MTCLNVAENKRLSWESESHDPSPHLCVRHDVQNMNPILRPVFCVLSKAAGWGGNKHQMSDAFYDPSSSLPRKLYLDFYTLVTLESDLLHLSSVPSARYAKV